jgi:hypothetical protein
MKNFIILLMVLFISMLSTPAYAVRGYGATALTGGALGALDDLDITGASTPNPENLAEGDTAVVLTISGTTVKMYRYIFDASGTDATSSPSVIRPEDYASAGNWRLVRIVSSSFKPEPWSAEPPDTAIGDTYVADGNNWNPASYGTNDHLVFCTAAGPGGTYVALMDMVTGASLFSSIDMTDGIIILPTTNTGDVALTTEGQIHFKSDEDLIVIHGGTAGEAQGEAAFSILDHIVWIGDPANAYSSDTQAFIMTVGDDYPHGMTIVEWKLSCNIDPTPEILGDLMRATAWIGLGTPTVMDVCDTTAGVSSEDTAANINSDSAIANGSVIYFSFDSDPAGTCDQMILELWAYAEED